MYSRQHKLNELQQIDRPETIIIPLGSLVDLNNMATGAAFMDIAAKPGKLQDGAKLGQAEVLQALPAVLELDVKLQAGVIEPAEFRKSVKKILKLQKKNVDDKEFDHAWNAMLGDVKKVADRIEELKKQYPQAEFVLVSVTNIIHMQHMFSVLEPDTKLDMNNTKNPFLLLDLPLYVSFRSDAFKAKPTNKSLCEEVFKDRVLPANKTTIVINAEGDSNTYDDVKKREDANAASVKLWATTLGMTVIERQPKEAVIDAINKVKHPVAQVKLGM